MQKLNAKTSNWEIYSGLRARPPLVVRADGRGFKKILENCKKPYDLEFARSMTRVGRPSFSRFWTLAGLGFYVL